MDICNIKKRKWTVLAQNFAVFLAVYGVFAVIPHYSQDTFNVLQSGQVDVNFNAGRFVHALFYSILDWINPGLYKNLMFNQSLFIIVISFLSAEVYSLFFAEIDNTRINSLIVQLASIILFVNPSIMEGWVYFPETCAGGSLSITIAYLSIFLWCKGYKNSKPLFCVLSFVVLLICMNMYQVYIENYIITTTFYLMISSKGQYSLRDVKYESSMLIGGAIVSALCLYSIRFFQLLGLIGESTRTDSLSIERIIQNIKTLFFAQENIWKDFNGYLPSAYMIILGGLIVIMTILYLREQKPLQMLGTFALMIGSYVVIFLPHLVSTIIWAPPRTLHGFFSFAVGVMIFAALIKEHWLKKIVVVCLLFLIILSGIRNQEILINNIVANRLDEEVALLIEHEIQTYEEESGVEITEIAYGYDNACRYGYSTVDYTYYDTNVRAYAVSWAAIEMINYHNNTNYSKRYMTEQEKLKYFGNVSYNSLDLSEQMTFSGNTAFLLVY